MLRLAGRPWPGDTPPKGRILYLTNQSPLPPHSGGQVREWQFLSHLSATWEVDFVAVTLYRRRDVDHVQPLLEHSRSATFFAADPSSAPPGTPERLREVANPEVARYLAALADSSSFDFIHVEGYFLVPHLPPALDLPIFLAAENIEYELERARQAVDGSSGGPQWTVIRDLEQQAWDRAAACGAVTPHDVAVIRARRQDERVYWLPPGCDHFSAEDAGGERLDRIPPSAKRVVYTGSAEWAPSRDGTFHLVHDVWPRVIEQVPDAQLVIAGKGQTADELGLNHVHPSVHLCGTLPSLGPLLRSADVFVCPIRFGSGVKSKMLEALHAGCAIVSTPAGLQGLEMGPRSAVWAAATAVEIAAGVTTLLTDRVMQQGMKVRAATASAELVTWEEATARLDAAWSTMLQPAPSPAVSIQQD